MMNSELLEAIKAQTNQRAGHDEINCQQLMQLAELKGVTLKEIGTLCNEHAIRIKNCQLGCFK